MTSYLYAGHFDLVTPDGFIQKITHIDPTKAIADVMIQNISPAFVGYQIDSAQIIFNLKSVLAQLGINGIGKDIVLDQEQHVAQLKVELFTIGQLAREMLPLLTEGAYIGKLFAADERRRVRSPHYLTRMFGRSDRDGRPLLSLGGLHGSEQLTLEINDGRSIAYLALKEGKIEYTNTIHSFLPTLGRALKEKKLPLRDFLRLHQKRVENARRIVDQNEILLVASAPLHIRTVFARVVDSLLPKGYQHTSASILQPDTFASGDIYELFGASTKEIYDIPLEFYTLEPHREHVFFSDRDQLQSCLEEPKSIFEAFETIPSKDNRAAVFIVKGSQMVRLKPDDWIMKDPPLLSFPGISHKTRQSLMVERYIEQQPCYPFLKAIESGLISSQGVLLTRYFPSPLMKRMLLSYYVQSHLMGLYFQIPSRSHGDYFSQEDRAMLIDLVTFGIPVFWADKTTGQILQYVQRPNKTSGMFVPLKKVETFEKATFFGIYGSNLTAGNFETELKKLLVAIIDMRSEIEHPLISKNTPLALVTGGGPGAMEMGNRIAKELDILSCANIVDFQLKPDQVVNEQRQNPYVEAKMTYRLDQLIERQAEFYLDFPIFVMGGIGTDFEFALEEVRNKVGCRPFGPILLFGEPTYWKEKITSRFQNNKKHGTIKGSEWVSNCFFCIQTAEQAIQVYRDFFSGVIKIGREGPIYEEGFVAISADCATVPR